jgi:hypothetical protein
MTDNTQFTPDQWQKATEQARELGRRIAAATEKKETGDESNDHQSNPGCKLTL